MRWLNDCGLFVLVGLRFEGVPEIVVGNRCRDDDVLVTDRVHELDTASMQRYASIGIAALGTVFQVALDGATDGRQLAAYLVVTTRLEVNLKQRIAVATGNGTIRKDSALCLTVDGFAVAGEGMPLAVEACDDVGLVLLLVAGEEMLKASLRLGRRIGNDCPVGLLDFVVRLEHVVEPCQRLTGAREKHNPARGAVETMRDAKEDLAELVVLFLDVCLDGLGEGRVARLVALHNLAARLVDGYDMIIFV